LRQRRLTRSASWWAVGSRAVAARHEAARQPLAARHQLRGVAVCRRASRQRQRRLVQQSSVERPLCQPQQGNVPTNRNTHVGFHPASTLPCPNSQVLSLRSVPWCKVQAVVPCRASVPAKGSSGPAGLVGRKARRPCRAFPSHRGLIQLPDAGRLDSRACRCPCRLPPLRPTGPALAGESTLLIRCWQARRGPCHSVDGGENALFPAAQRNQVVT
jgi:hypothetical protein